MFGPNTVKQIGRSMPIVADPSTAREKAGGLTIDWTTVPAIGKNEKWTITIDATGGTFTVTFGAKTTSAIAYNAAAATVEASLEALSTIGNGNVNVSGSAGGPYTLEFVGTLAYTDVGAVTCSGASLTGGAGTATPAKVQDGVSNGDATLADGTIVKSGDKYLLAGTVLAKITASGKYGPHDTTVSDGRQTLTRGDCWLLTKTLVMSEQGSAGTGFVIDAGLVWKDRLQIDGTGQVTSANFATAFPGIDYA